MSEYLVGGRWDVHQSNGYHVIFEIGQHPPDGQDLVGSATLDDGTTGGGSGRVQGNQFHFRVEWPNGSVGIYNGTFALDGRISGISFDETHPESQATWWSGANFEK